MPEIEGTSVRETIHYKGGETSERAWMVGGKVRQFLFFFIF